MTAASVRDYRPRLDRRVARSKARPGRSRGEKKRSSAMRHPRTARSHTDGGRSKACAAKERDSPVDVMARREERGAYRSRARGTGINEEGTTARESREGGRWPRARP